MSNEDFVDACFRGDLEAVKGMVLLGADPNLKDKSGDSALHSAIENRNLEVVKFLLEAGADPNAEDRRGWTPLYHTIEVEADVASQLGESVPSTRVLRLLLGHGADPNRPSSTPGFPRSWESTPLRLARGLRSEHVVQILLAAGAKE
jgi:cytohesin